MGEALTKELDCSPTVLAQTSADDKFWLSIKEEALFNDSFVHEKYYMLYPDEVDEASTRSMSATKFSRSSTPTTTTTNTSSVLISDVDEDTLLFEALNSDKTLTRDEIVHTFLEILHRLRGMWRETTPFQRILHKRLCLLYRMYVALWRERTRRCLLLNRITTSSESLRSQQPPTPLTKQQHEPNKNSHTVMITSSHITQFHEIPQISQIPAVVRMTVRLFVTMIQEQRNVEMSGVMLERLHSMLRILPPLSLHSEAEDCLDSFRQWLHFTFSSSESSPTMRIRAIESLLSLALAQGSLRHILTTVSLILLPTRPEDDITHLPLRVNSLLRQLSAWTVELPLSALSSAFLTDTWTIACHHVEEGYPNPAVTSFFNPTTTHSPSAPTLASDGTYLYLHDIFGLLKIGTGKGGTVQVQSQNFSILFSYFLCAFEYSHFDFSLSLNVNNDDRDEFTCVVLSGTPPRKVG
jgi:hypothetical protein